MAQVHVTEAEVVQNIQALLDQVRSGTEVLIEQGDRVIAVLTPVLGPGRPLDECITIARARRSDASLDEDFARDLQELIAHRQPLDAPAWD